MTSTDLSLRPASPDDADRIARLYSEARVAAVPSMPPAVHTPEEDRAWLAGRLAGGAEGWVAERGPGLCVGLHIGHEQVTFLGASGWAVLLAHSITRLVRQEQLKRHPEVSTLHCERQLFLLGGERIGMPFSSEQDL